MIWTAYKASNMKIEGDKFAGNFSCELTLSGGSNGD